MIDDSVADRQLCRLLLRETHGAGLQFFEASSAEPGLEACRNLRPDCILLDYALPGVSGLECLALLRSEHGVDSGVAVVMLTGLASEQVAIEALKAGAQDYLVKDQITAQSLRLAIQKATQKAALTRDLREERDRLARSLAEKEVLIREVHHRVKNNLQVIASLLRLQAEASADSTVMAALRNSQQRVESMALIHEQLYQSEDLRQVNLEEHVRQLLSNLLNVYGMEAGRISTQVVFADAGSGFPVLLGVDQAIPLGLILNELVTNALKHAFPAGRSGTIAIEARRDNGRITISVTDDGVGLVEGAPEKPRSLGLRIVDILSRQLKGKVETETNGGATFRVSFPHR